MIMKTFRIFPIAILLLAIANLSIAQSNEESFKVYGNCGMCKSKIEKAATSAGATYAVWDQDTKVLTVKYNSTSTNTAKIQKKIAKAGYDNEGLKAKDEDYNKLHGCCKYDREAVTKESCCSEKCEMKDGKCADMAACKDKDCCKDSEKSEEKGCCSAEKKDGAMACCKKDAAGGSCCAKKSDQ
jgi:periplasmic mercuric ion binding protein